MYGYSGYQVEENAKDMDRTRELKELRAHHCLLGEVVERVESGEDFCGVISLAWAGRCEGRGEAVTVVHLPPQGIERFAIAALEHALNTLLVLVSPERVREIVEGVIATSPRG